jgi:lantibiotic modifying enzyme
MKRMFASGRSRYLDAAERIGAAICGQAIWHENRCNWIGEVPEPELAGAAKPSYVSLRSDFYGGTSGVALFLARLHSVCGDKKVRHVALGAIRHSLTHVREHFPPADRGLYVGRTGVALAGAYVGHLLDEEGLVIEALKLLKEVRRVRNGSECDLMGGAAGAIIALLMMGELSGERWPSARALDLGDELLDMAELSKSGMSWSSPMHPRQRNLCGFSHGTAGIGYALLELYKASGAMLYRDVAVQAFEYERGFFNPSAGNWPDLRNLASHSHSIKMNRYPAFWCHGAPGIALSRLRAFELLGDKKCRAEAIIALETTGKTLAALRSGRLGNYSLCHGATGNADVLQYGDEVLGPCWGGARKALEGVGDTGIDMFFARNRPWLAEKHYEGNPGLFLGTSGIGYFYLRLHDPSVPSILIFRPQVVGSTSTVGRLHAP